MKRSKMRRIAKVVSYMNEATEITTVVDSVNGLSWEDAGLLFEYLDEQERKRAPQLLEEFANLQPDTIVRARKMFPVLTEQESDDELRKLAADLRSVWPGKDWPQDEIDALLEYPASKVTTKWLYHHPLDILGELTPERTSAWIHHRALCAYRPFVNLHAMMARAYLMNKRKLTRCANDECGRYFVTHRHDPKPEDQQKYCLATGCRKYRNRLKANQHNKRKKSTS